MFSFGLTICNMFQYTCWRFSCTIIDYSEVIYLTWTTYSFYPCIKRFFTLNKLCLLCVLDFYFAFYILLVFLMGSYKFGRIYFHWILLCSWVYNCVDLFSIKIMDNMTCTPPRWVSYIQATGNQIMLHVDGSCQGNSGPAALLQKQFFKSRDLRWLWRTALV